MGCGPSADTSKDKSKAPAPPAVPTGPAAAPMEVRKEGLASPVKATEVKKEEQKVEVPKEVKVEAESKKEAPVPEAKKEPVEAAAVEKVAKPPVPEGVNPPIMEPKPEVKTEVKTEEMKMPAEAKVEIPVLGKPIEVNLEELKKAEESKAVKQVVEEIKKIPVEEKKEPPKEAPKDPLKVLAELGYKLPKAQLEEDTEPVHAVHNMMYVGALRAAVGKPAEGRMPPSTTVMSGIIPSGAEGQAPEEKKDASAVVKETIMEQGQVKAAISEIKKVEADINKLIGIGEPAPTSAKA